MLQRGLGKNNLLLNSRLSPAPKFLFVSPSVYLELCQEKMVSLFAKAVKMDIV